MMAGQVIPPRLAVVAGEVAKLLKGRKETISVVETAAGGLVSAALLATPGASGIYKGGLTLYTLPSRVQFAGWTQTDIDNYRGPTPDIVGGLAENVRSKLESTYCVAESGTAGPTGGSTPNRIPGYVALAVASIDATQKIDIDTGKGPDREQNMLEFAIAALNLVKSFINDQSQM